MEKKMVWLWGWHVFLSILDQKKRKIYKINILKRHYEKVLQLTSNLNININIICPKEMNDKFGQNHQGIAICVDQIKLYSLKEWISMHENIQNVVLVACDFLEDPHNLGAIIRSAKSLGAHGLLITKNKTTPLNGVVAKAASGALESLSIIQVSNLSCALLELQKFGYTVFGLDHQGKKEYTVLNKNVIVMGQEGKGMRALTKNRCNHLISIDTVKEFPILNVSVAAGIVLFNFYTNFNRRINQ